MALLDKENLAAEAARRAKYRVHHVGTKLNENELHEFETLAAKRKQTHGEMIRGLIQRELKQDTEGVQASLEMVEITAVRLLLINLLRPVATGQSMMEKTFDSIVEETRKRKAEVAHGLVEKALRG